MVNEIATLQGGNGHHPPMAPANKALYDFAEMKELAKAVAESGFINGLRSPASALALMLVCQAQGRHIGEAITRFHVIKNTPSVKTDVLLADFQARGGRVRWIESTAEVCRAEFSHPKLHPEPFPVAVTMRDLIENKVAMEWKEEKAGQGKYVEKKIYKQFPAQMLRARCISQGVTAIDPGARHGFATPEEADDALVVDAEVVAREPETIPSRPAPRSDVHVPGQPSSPNGLDERPYPLVVSEATAAVNTLASQFAADRLKGEVPPEIVPGLAPRDVHKWLLNAATQEGLYTEGPPAKLQHAVGILGRLYQERRDWMREQLNSFFDAHIHNVSTAVRAEAERRAADTALDRAEDESQEDAAEAEFAGLRAAREPGSDG